VVGSGRDTVIVLHGGPGQHMGYLENLPPLAAGGTLLFYDQRGSGRSSLPTAASQLTGDIHVADLETVRQHFGLGRVTLLGHSWGGLLAGLYAVQHPARVARLILVAPAPPRADLYLRQERFPRILGPDFPRFAALAAAMDTTATPQTVCQELATIFVRAAGSDTATVRRVAAGACDAHPEALRRGWTTTQMWTLQSLGRWDLRPRLPAVSAPTLVIAGARDQLVTVEMAREWLTALPNARIEIMTTAGHYPFADDPARFAMLVREFLGRD
jgi:proline iminopeptidase